MAKKILKKEALSVARLINEVLVNQLNIPFRNIVNDTSFTSYTGSKRPDLMISNVEYTGNNDDEYIKNLLCYVEAKDPTCSVDDRDWLDAIKQAKDKSAKLGITYFGITNCKTSFFYNAITNERLKMNGNYINEFQTLDVFRTIRKKLKENPKESNIKMGVDSLSSVSEAVFNKKLWELKEEFRSIDFENNTQKIDFTIGMIALEYYEEKIEIEGKKDLSQEYWSNGKQYISDSDIQDKSKALKLKTLIVSYINRLMDENSDFKEFSPLLVKVKSLIDGSKAIISPLQLQSIYPIIDSMKPMHGTGFDLFGAVYENFANAKEKKDFGEYFTRRHYAHVLAELLLQDEDVFRQIKILDPTCGTGGMLTESFKVLKASYENTGTYTDRTAEYLSKECFYGIDIRSDNISRSRLNMFLVGDGHNNMFPDNSLNPEKEKGKEILKDGSYDYIITNPPYGAGTIQAVTNVLKSNRMEVAFICKIIDLLKVNGKACIITPDGILENPTFTKLRLEILELCHVEAIISLPKFAFAPYTKEKTFAVFLKKKHDRPEKASIDPNIGKRNLSTGKVQTTPIWMYIIDNDGFANSDKRFPTRLRHANQEWLHDEVSGYSDNEGEEHKAILVQRWKTFDDKLCDGTEWMNEKGIIVKQRKGGYIDIRDIMNDGYITLLPEKYLRPCQSHFVDEKDFHNDLDIILKSVSEIPTKKITKLGDKIKGYQATGIPVSQILDYISGNSGLTEEFLYNNLGLKGKRYLILSSATQQENMLGEIPMCEINGKKIKVFSGDKDGLLVIRKGKAGRTVYLKPGFYTLNDDAYILFVKEDCPYKIHLKWLSIQYKSEFLAYASSSDNGTWNMTGFFNNVIVDIPTYEEQQRIVNAYEEAEKIKEKIALVKTQIDLLLN